MCKTLVTAIGDGCLVWTDLLARSGPGLAAVSHSAPAALAVLQGLLHAELAHKYAPGPTDDVSPRIFSPAARAQAKAFVAPELHSYLERFEVSGLALLPLRDRKGVRGTVAIWRDAGRDAFAPDDLALLETCLDYCALTLENAQLYEAEQQLRARLDATLDQLPVGVIVADEGGKTLLCNRASREILGDTMQAGLAISVLQQSDQYERATGEFYPPGRMPIGRALAGEVVRGEEVLVRLPGGSQRTIRASGAPVLSEAGLPLGGVVAFEDISAQKAAAREREKMVQFQEQFLGILGHDTAQSA